MNGPRPELKQASGWFAAGAGVLRAATRLSDGAFKVFVWICLHADRSSGCLRVLAADLARSLGKPEAEIRAHLEELVRTGICRSTGDSLIVRESYWPYERPPAQPESDDSQAFVAAVRQLFLSYACVSGTFSAADERLASEWRRRGIALERVQRAIHLGLARKYTALINHGTGTLITTLHYFQHLIDEVDQTDMSSDYWSYVAVRCRDYERRWRALGSASGSRSTGPAETK